MVLSHTGIYVYEVTQQVEEQSNSKKDNILGKATIPKKSSVQRKTQDH